MPYEDIGDLPNLSPQQIEDLSLIAGFYDNSAWEPKDETPNVIDSKLLYNTYVNAWFEIFSSIPTIQEIDMPELEANYQVQPFETGTQSNYDLDDEFAKLLNGDFEPLVSKDPDDTNIEKTKLEHAEEESDAMGPEATELSELFESLWETAKTDEIFLRFASFAGNVFTGAFFIEDKDTTFPAFSDPVVSVLAHKIHSYAKKIYPNEPEEKTKLITEKLIENLVHGILQIADPMVKTVSEQTAKDLADILSGKGIAS